MKKEAKKRTLTLVNPYIPGEIIKDGPNPFSLYYLELPSSSSVPERNQSLKASREFKELWKEFVEKWKALQQKHERVGASDTAARDAQVDWIKKYAVEIH